MRRAKLGEVEFSVVEEESPEYAAEIAERTVENGQDLVDHVRQRPITLNISGVVVGEEAGSKLAKLRDYARKSTVLKYVGRNIFGNMVIQSLPTSHTFRIRNGFQFRMELKAVRFAKSKFVQFVAPDPVAPAATTAPAGDKSTSSQTTPDKDKGEQQQQDKDVDESEFNLWIADWYEGLVDYFDKSEPARFEK